MKLTCKSAPLISALDTASLAISGNRNMPALTCALVECFADGRVSVTCDSMQARVSVEIKGESSDEDFSFLAAPRLLKAAMRGDMAEIRYNDQERKLKIKSKGDTTMSCLGISEFNKSWGVIPSKPIEAGHFLNGIKMAAACSGGQYENIYWDAKGKIIFGTNTKVLGCQPLELGIKESFVLTSNTSKLITSCFDADELEIGQHNHTLFFKQENRQAWVKAIEAPMLPYADLVIDCEPFASVGRELLQKALESLADFTESEFQKSTIDPTGEAWLCQSKSISGESSVPIEEVEKMDGEGAEVFTFNRLGMINAVRYWGCDRVLFRRKGNTLMLSSGDEDGRFAICPLYRAD